MKAVTLSLIVSFGLLGAGCEATHVAGRGELPIPVHPPVQQAPLLEGETLPPLVIPPGSGLTPPTWYSMEQPNYQLDQLLKQQQWSTYNQNRIPSPQFPRAPICHSTQMGGQIVTNCF